MPGYIDKNGNYYEADKNITESTEVPIRPTENSVWVDGAWVEIVTVEKAKAKKLSDLVASRIRLNNLRYAGNNNGTQFEITDPAIMQALIIGWVGIKDNPIGQLSIRDDHGVEVTFSSTALNLALPLITGAKKQIEDRYWQRRAAIENAASVADVNAVDTELSRGKT